MKNVKPRLLLFIFVAVSVSLAALAVSVIGVNVGAYQPTDDITVDCGSSSNSIVDGRTWIGDADGSSNYSPIEKTRSSVIATANSPSPAVLSRFPFYYTARLSRSEFAYTFHVTAGPKFVRLHFFPSDYLGFRRADSFFSVEAAGYTLLRDFRAHLFADYTSSASFSKEFCLTVGEDQMLNITFTPTPGDSDTYAFVNGIEVVSMPKSLYYNTVVDLNEGIELAGQATPYTFSATDALEAVKRLNVGGKSIGPADDTGMYRTWDADDIYVTSTYIGVLPVNTTIQLSYSDKVPNYTAPDIVYMTARTMGTNKSINLSYNLTWSVDVDAKFYYLVRLHFCEFQKEINKPTDRLFEIFINSQLVENRADVISWSGKDMPVYRDYAVYMQEGQKKRTNLSVALGALPDGYTLYSDGILNGLEIFKINNPGGNLAGSNPDLVPDNQPVLPPASKVSSSSKTAKIAIIVGVASGFAVLSLLAFFLYRRRNGAKDSTSSDDTSWWGPVSFATTKSTKTQGSSLPSDLCRHFSLAEIRAATNNFDEVFIIGVGGFGNVYKGYVDGGATQVAIKRLNPGSQQGLHEFMTEIEMLSQLRHLHLVSLIGFCNDAGEMILVYDYMTRGTLRDHLYNTHNPPLPWKQRLEICTGAARGLHYLHTGARHTIIHRDMKTTNILLDEKWVAKVSDFGLSKVGPTSVSKAHVSTVVKGTFGYLDPEYYRRQQLTDKSDVYSFGVVLFEVLCARPAVNRTAQKKQISLAAWAQSCCKSGAVDKMVDPHLKGAIAPECLNKFCEIAMSCLQDEGTKRPSMNDVVWGLEFALQLQVSSEKDVITDHLGASLHNGGGDSDDDAAPIGGYRMDRSDELFSTSNSGSRKSRGAAMTATSSNDVYDESTTSYDSDKLLSGAVFSEIMNPKAR